MMFLSTLLINVGDNPDRPRPGRLWLRNRYHVHQRLCMAFPSENRRDGDPQFLMPYAPEDFPEVRHLAERKGSETDHATLAQIHTPRSDGAGFLFRVDPLPGGRAMILVLSHGRPDWNYAFGLIPERVDPRTGRPVGNAGYLLAAPPAEPRPFEISLIPGARLRFRLTANPTKKTGSLLKKERLDKKELKEEVKGRHGRRVPVASDAFGQWLVDRSEGFGFRLVEPIGDTLEISAGYVYFNKTRDSGKGQRLRSVSYEGLLEVVDVDLFRKTLLSGIGPGKAFGFGLLSIAPVRQVT